MKGSIRAIVGLVITMFGVGGVENSITNPELVIACAVSAIGLALMASGIRAMNKVA